MVARSAHMLVLVLALSAGCLSLTGCQDSGISAPQVAERAQFHLQAARGAHDQQMVPIHWTYHVEATGEETLQCQTADGAPLPQSISVNWAFTGSASHLGRLDEEESTARFTSCVIDMVDGMPVSAAGDARVELVGADGDAVFMNGILTLWLAEYEATGVWDITGGTGRFEGADGWIETLEVPAPDGQGSDGSGSGMITPPGALNH